MNMNYPGLALKWAARLALRATFSSPAGPLAEHAVRSIARRAPYTLPGRGVLVAELSRVKKEQLVAELLCGAKMSVPPIPEGVSVYLAGCLMGEEPTTNCLTCELEPGDCFLDIGANLGFYSLLAATRVGSAGQVHAFEPQPALAAQLRRSVELNDFSERVTVNNVAVTDRDGETVELHLAEDQTRTGIASIFAHEWLASVGMNVPTCNIDSYVGTHPSAGTYVIKIDIEGAELMALRGMAGLLARAKTKLLVVELFPAYIEFPGGKRLLPDQNAATPLNVVSYLAHYGYEPRAINRNGSLGDALSLEKVVGLELTTNVAFVKARSLSRAH